MKRAFLYQGPVIIWSLTIFGLSSISKFPSVPWQYHPDKIVHLVVYGLLGLAAYRAFANQTVSLILKANPAIGAVVFTALYGLSDEFHQQFVPGRTFDVYDLLTDIIGAVMAVWLLLWWKRRQLARHVR